MEPAMAVSTDTSGLPSPTISRISRKRGRPNQDWRFGQGGVRPSDSPLERAGFEPSVPRRGRRRLRKFSRCRLFRLSGAEVSRRNAGRIGGFEEGEFEADGATKRSGMTVVPI